MTDDRDLPAAPDAGNPPPSAPAGRPDPALAAGLPVLILGLAAATFSRSLDGFWQGLTAGAGVVLILVGVYVVGAARGWRSGRSAGWLPSRDERDGRD